MQTDSKPEPITPSERSLTPISAGPKANRYLNSRKIQYAPGFDLTANTHQTSPNDHLFTTIRQPPSYYTDLGFTSLSTSPLPSCQYRRLPVQAQKILDAPQIVDDYYLNLLDWSDTNQLAVALNNKLYLWNALSGSVSQLLQYSSQVITSVSWMKSSKCLAVGDSSHSLRLYDLQKQAQIRHIQNHTDRVSSLAWNGYILSSGSRDSQIIQHDMRIQNYFVKYSGHSQEVCGLRWNKEGTQLASGGNDNKLCIWDLSSVGPQLQITAHQAAVKALAWCPWKSHVLASGGGSVDRSLKIWNTSQGVCVSSVDTGSQVCALEWNQHEQELLSAHGHSNNQLSLWKFPELRKVGDFFGHGARVLCMDQNPEGSTVVTASADETLRFWNIFESSVSGRGKEKEKSPSMGFNYR